MTTVSYAITVCNEFTELKNLLQRLVNCLRDDDEIVILVDESNTTDDVKSLCAAYSRHNIHYHYRPFDKDFAAHKNYLNEQCTKEWIFNIDADEYPNGILLNILHELLSSNDEVDMIAVPRVNIVDGITDEHIQKWNWKVDGANRVNWPDYQLRLYRNKPEIMWSGKVHEVPKGWKVGSHLPYETDDYALVHIKSIQKQEKQNELYSTI